MNDIVIEVRGGVVVGAYTDVPDARIVLVDWDDIEAGDPARAYPPGALAEIPEETAAEMARAGL